MTKPRVLIVGSANFIASRVADALHAAGWATPVAAECEPRGLYGVVNAAAGSPRSILSQALRAEAIARASGPQTRLVHLSSMTVYGSLDRHVDETTAPLADLGAYAAAQIEAERVVQAHAGTVTLRLGCEYGPGCPQWSERIARLLLARRLGDLGAAGDGCCNLLFIDDLVASIVAALQRASVEGEVFNLAVPSPPTWNEYFTRFGIALRAVPIRRLTARRLALEAKFLAVPLKVMEAAAQRASLAPAFAAPALTPSLLKLCKQRITMDVGKAESRLGMTWTRVADGIERTAAAIRAARP